MERLHGVDNKISSTRNIHVGRTIQLVNFIHFIIYSNKCKIYSSQKVTQNLKTE